MGRCGLTIRVASRMARATCPAAVRTADLNHSAAAWVSSPFGKLPSPHLGGAALLRTIQDVTFGEITAPNQCGCGCGLKKQPASNPQSAFRNPHFLSMAEAALQTSSDPELLSSARAATSLRWPRFMIGIIHPLRSLSDITAASKRKTFTVSSSKSAARRHFRRARGRGSVDGPRQKPRHRPPASRIRQRADKTRPCESPYAVRDSSDDAITRSTEIVRALCGDSRAQRRALLLAYFNGLRSVDRRASRQPLCTVNTLLLIGMTSCGVVARRWDRRSST